MELILAGAMLTLSACQATPTEDVIVQKAEQQEMLTQAAETSPDMEGKNLRNVIRFRTASASMYPQRMECGSIRRRMRR